jgi:flagellar motor switch protein FliN/FliY
VTNPEINANESPQEPEATVVDPNGRRPLDALLDVSVPVVIEFGRTSMMLQDVLELGPGSVVELDRAVGEPIAVYVSDRKLAEGEVVVIDDHFGVRITKILSDRVPVLAE